MFAALCGFGGVLSMRFSTASRFAASDSNPPVILRGLAMADQSETVILPPAYYEVIGALTANAATLDLLIDHMIAVFLRVKS